MQPQGKKHSLTVNPKPVKRREAKTKSELPITILGEKANLELQGTRGRAEIIQDLFNMLKGSRFPGTQGT